QTEELHPAPGISDFHCLSCPGIVFGAKGGNLHAAEEWVDLASMLRVEKNIPKIISHFYKAVVGLKNQSEL
ncbi:MAG: hypothetical protein WC304_03835, partial [Candidatus Gracilibacteria bacterium]